MATMRAKQTVTAPVRRASATTARAHVIDVPFEMRAAATASGARWDADHGVFVFRGDALPKALEAFRAAPYSWERRVEAELNDEADPVASKPAATITPRPHQRDAVRAILAAV